MNKDLRSYVKERYEQKFVKELFDMNWNSYLELEPFAPNENVFDEQEITEETHFIMRSATQYYLHMAFDAMKMDMTDDNVSENLVEGNIGTPGRLAKVWCGANLHDDSELGSGRWAKKPRLARFPNTNTSRDIPITKRVDVVSNCSHHLISFNTLNRPDSYAYVSYIPEDFVLGISKLQRITDWLSRRFWLQEDLTNALYRAISEAADTKSVYIKIVNAVHGCEQLRGSQSNDGAFSSEMYDGKFKDPELRKEVDRSI